MTRDLRDPFKRGYEGERIARDARKKGSGNSKQGGPASKDKPTDFYGPGGMLPTSKIKA